MDDGRRKKRKTPVSTLHKRAVRNRTKHTYTRALAESQFRSLPKCNHRLDACSIRIVIRGTLEEFVGMSLSRKKIVFIIIMTNYMMFYVLLYFYWLWELLEYHKVHDMAHKCSIQTIGSVIL